MLLLPWLNMKEFLNQESTFYKEESLSWKLLDSNGKMHSRGVGLHDTFHSV